MIEQLPTEDSLDLSTTPFLQVVLSQVKYHLLHDGPDKTKEAFAHQASLYGELDGWGRLKRQVDDMILACRQERDGSAHAGTGEELLENTILRKYQNGHRIDFHALCMAINQCFVSQLQYCYDWLALWRVLYDLKLLEDTHLEAFAKQMNKWFPGLAKPCKSDSMGDYAKPYLGYTPHKQWTEAAFRQHQTKKQSISGYIRLRNLCTTLTEALARFAQ